MAKEYTIFIQCKNGRPYNICVFKTFQEAMSSLNNMIDLERERNRPYYVLNDFYDNEYPCSLGGKVYCVKERTVSDWENYSSEHKFNNYYNNVYQFPNIFK